MDLRELDNRALDLVLKLTRNLSPTQLDDATPCEGWAVRDLLGHLVEVNEQWTAAARGGPATEPRRPADSVAAVDTSVDQVRDAFAAHDVFERTFELPFMTLDGRSAIAVHFLEVLVHAWDLARATGQDETLDRDLAERALEIAARIPDEFRGPGNAFGEKYVLPEERPAHERLVALLGRVP